MRSPLFNYTWPCTCGHPELFEKLLAKGEVGKYLGEDSSLEEVRDYFFMVHNSRELENRNLAHLVVPYKIENADTDVIARVRQPFFALPNGLNEIRVAISQVEGYVKRDVIVWPNRGDVVVSHAGVIVDMIDEEKLKEYDSLYRNESFSIR